MSDAVKTAAGIMSEEITTADAETMSEVITTADAETISEEITTADAGTMSEMIIFAGAGTMSEMIMTADAEKREEKCAEMSAEMSAEKKGGKQDGLMSVSDPMLPGRTSLITDAEKPAAVRRNKTETQKVRSTADFLQFKYSYRLLIGHDLFPEIVV